MKQFEKGRQQIVIFLIIYIAISIMVGMSSFKYLSPKFISLNTIIGLYSLFSIIAATAVYIYTRKRFVQATSIENSYSFLSEQERKEREQKEREIREKELKKRRAEENAKFIAEKIVEISEGLDSKDTLENYLDQLLINISKSINIVQGVAYILNNETEKFEIKSTYAYYTTDTGRTFEIGEGIPGQVAKDKKVLFIDNVPQGYIKVVSGLGTSSPNNLIVIPIVYNDKSIGVIELASFEKTTVDFNKLFADFNDKLAEQVQNLLQK